MSEEEHEVDENVLVRETELEVGEGGNKASSRKAGIEYGTGQLGARGVETQTGGVGDVETEGKKISSSKEG